MKGLVQWVLENKKDDDIEVHMEKEANDPKVQKNLGTGDVDKIKEALIAVFKRGYGAAQSNWNAVRPHIKKLGKEGGAIAWGHARVNVFRDKGKTYQTADSDWADWLKGKGDKPKG